MSNPIEKKKKGWCYDIECYTNFFSAVFIHHKTEETRRFIIFHDMRDRTLDINDYDGLLSFILTEVTTLIGYNSHSYDDVIIKHLVFTAEFFKNATPQQITNSCKNLSDKIINSQNKENKGLRDAYIDALRSRKLFGSLDLMLLFNTINRVGLKQLAINLRWPEIIDLPFDPSHIVVREEVDKIMYYNANDTKITKAVLYNREEVIKYRKDYTAEYDTNVINSNDTNIAKTVIRKFYSEVTKKKFDEYKDKRTFHKELQLRHCISRKITFMTKVYQEALNKFRNSKINPNKIDDEFKGLSVDETGRLITGKKKGKQFEHIIKTKYLTHTLGIGGIHSNNDSEIIEEDNEYELIDADVTSYYPSIMIEERLYPNHLGPEFIKVYKDKLYYPRLAAKSEGKTALAEMLKIALNSTFGLTKSIHSWLYDPHVAISITVSGQLYLLMLIERLEYYTDCVVVYSNTDGITVKVPKTQKQQFYDICRQWSEYTRFGLEFTNFKKMVMRDVNNYLMQTYSDDPKKEFKVKGSFQTKMPVTAGFVYPVIAKALHAYYAKGISPEVFVKSQNDIYDFMKAERTSPTKFDIMFRSLANPEAVLHLGKHNRWIVTAGFPDEGKLVKFSKKRQAYAQMQKDRKVTILNDLSDPLPDIGKYKLDYDFYLNEIYKVIRPIKPRHQKKVRYEQLSFI